MLRAYLSRYQFDSGRNSRLESECKAECKGNDLIQGGRTRLRDHVTRMLTSQQFFVTFILCVAVWYLVYIGKSKPEGINSCAFDFCVLQNY